jgi:hypothetical protein
MKKSRLPGAARACIAIFTTPQAMSITIDTCLGNNYILSDIFYRSFERQHNPGTLLRQS